MVGAVLLFLLENKKWIIKFANQQFEADKIDADTLYNYTYASIFWILR